MTLPRTLISASTLVLLAAVATLSGQGKSVGVRKDGKHLFEKETFGGNGRTCRTCHSAETGTVSPKDAAARLAADADDPLFVHDGSDDGLGNGTARIVANATIRMEIPLPANVRLADDPGARSVIVLRGIPTTLNTPALDPVLMLDGRQPTLQLQATGAIEQHAQGVIPSAAELDRIKQFQLTEAFFSSPALRDFARGGAAPSLPLGRTASERRGRRFFEDLPAGPDGKDGLCSACHSGPLLNQTNRFLNDVGVNVPPGSRFQTVLVSELNKLGNPVRHFIFTNPDGSETDVFSPDPGRALITGVANDFGTFDSLNAFKISILRGVRNTGPYFHDNSAKTLEEVMDHYALFFQIVSGGFLVLTPQEKADMVAFMKLL
jgi:cytochrome c peroxidase